MEKPIEAYDGGRRIVDRSAVNSFRKLGPHIEKIFNYEGPKECLIPEALRNHKYESVEFSKIQTSRNELLKKMGLVSRFGPVEATRRETVLNMINGLQSDGAVDVLDEIRGVQNTLRNIQSAAFATKGHIGSNREKLEVQIKEEHRPIVEQMFKEMGDPSDHVIKTLREGNVMDELMNIIKTLQASRE